MPYSCSSAATESLIDYVQMICGLCIVGKVYLEAMIIAYGDGRNGKINVLECRLLRFWEVTAETFQRMP